MIPIEKGHLLSSALSHAGKGGKNNEDRFGLSAFQVSERDKEKAVFAIVADGRGGQRAGEVAAETVVNSISRAVAQSDASQAKEILHAAIIQAGQSVLAQSESEKEKRGMGSTCLCAWVIGSRLYTASVGNSRLYLYRQGRLQQLNIVHTIEDVKEGEAIENEGEALRQAPEELQGHLGSRMRASADFRLVVRKGEESYAERNQGMRLTSNDRLLLCTDGLSKALGEEEIAQVMGESLVEESAERLIEKALENDAQDNLTAVVLGMPPGKPWISGGGLGLRSLVRALIVVLLTAALSLAAWYFWQQSLDPGQISEPTPISTLTARPEASETP